VFFDEAKIAYEYELEGFALPSGAAYLSDFYLPAFALHVEVKPSNHIPPTDLKKMFEFALEGDHHVLLIVGTPTQEQMLLIDRRHDPRVDEIEADVGSTVSVEDVVAIIFERLCDRLSVAFESTPLGRKQEEWELVYREVPPYPLIGHALTKAREARFEFGEVARMTPNPAIDRSTCKRRSPAALRAPAPGHCNRRLAGGVRLSTACSTRRGTDTSSYVFV
jgi:hypothetical protein